MRELRKVDSTTYRVQNIELKGRNKDLLEADGGESAGGKRLEAHLRAGKGASRSTRELEKKETHSTARLKQARVVK